MMTARVRHFRNCCKFKEFSLTQNSLRLGGARLELNERLRAQDAELRLIEGSPMLGEKAPEGVDLTKWDPKHDAKFLMDIKSYALITDEDTIDARLFSELLYPLGYGERPIDAFELLVDLGIWTIRENPHLLRWDTTPLAFSPAEQEHAVRVRGFQQAFYFMNG
jgi:hypothetical protein